MDVATFTSGPLVTVVRMTIAIVMVMLPQCGPFQLIPPSILVKTLITMRVVPPLWLQRSPMELKTPTLEWYLNID
jgi:hypothetical protein